MDEDLPDRITDKLAVRVVREMFPEGKAPKVRGRLPRKLKKRMHQTAERTLLWYCISSRWTDDLEVTGPLRSFTLGGRRLGSKGFLRRLVAHTNFNMQQEFPPNGIP